MRSLGVGQASEHEGCDTCKAGYSCREAEKISDMILNACVDGEYCPSGYQYNQKCPAGKQGTMALAKSEMEGCEICPAGQYCTEGVAAGTTCDIGYYCLQGTSDPKLYPAPPGT